MRNSFYFLLYSTTIPFYTSLHYLYMNILISHFTWAITYNIYEF